ncbi:hypothetical protein N0V92_012762 [Colletotrichum tropicale]|nr:hypothetical protein N0V92_012762 [Colletotrichum tropicale]
MPATDTTKLPLEGGPAYGLGEVDRQGATSPMLRGLDGLSLYEKKCVLINREIDSQGMGKYQWYIWGLCGFGYMLDLLWAQAFGLVLKPLQQEMGFGNDQSGNIATSFNAGLTAGAFVWGFLADIIGMTISAHSKLERSLIWGLPRNLRAAVELTSARSHMGLQLDLPHRIDIWALLGRI